MQTCENKPSYKKFPYTIRKMKAVTHNKIVSDFRAIKDVFVQVGPEKWIEHPQYEEYADEIYNFETRPDDVWICTLPRSGTSWTQEIIWLICNNLDYEKAREIRLQARFIYLELHTVVNKTMVSEIIGALPNDMPERQVEEMRLMFEPPYERLAAMNTRRFIKTHLPIKLLPHNIMQSGARIVYVARNPKDVAVSYYYFSKSKGFDFKADFETYAQYFMEDMTVMHDELYFKVLNFAYGPYWKHILDGWNNRHHENVHFVFYEELKLDQENTLKKLANFLGNPLKDEDMPKLMDHISFEKMKNNEAINLTLPSSEKKAVTFVRRGKVGGNPEMTKDISRKIDQWTERNIANTDFQFPYAF